MMMALGQFVFELPSIVYQSLQRSTAWRHAAQARVGQRPARQFLGPGDDTISMPGVLYPEITGGRYWIEQLRRMGDTGQAFPLVEGTGRILGFWVIESVEETSSLFYADGTPQKIEFTLSLSHVDDPTPEMIATGTETASDDQ